MEKKKYNVIDDFRKMQDDKTQAAWLAHRQSELIKMFNSALPNKDKAKKKK